jgi:predicted permease
MISRLIAGARSIWSNLFRRKEVEAALDEELRSYVDLLAAEHERKGLTPEAARRAALVEVGGIEQVKESTRDAWLGDAAASASRELRYALRSLRRAPTYSIDAIATLGIGIGGATAVFTVVKGSLLRSLPGAGHPERLVTVERVLPNGLGPELSYPDFIDLRERAPALAALAGYNGTSMVLGRDGRNERVWVSYVSDDFFATLDARPALGSFFGTGGRALKDASDGSVVVISHEFWANHLGAAPNIVGTPLTLNGKALTVIGVAPKGFVGAMDQYHMELFIPLVAGGRATEVISGFGTELIARRSNWLRVIGRLAPGASLEDADHQLNSTSAWLSATYPERKWSSVRVLPGAGMTHEEREEISRIPRLLGMAVALLLLIACANVASLSLVRSGSRRRELATRLALGASQAVLVRQVMVEGAVVAAGAGLLGILLTRALVRSASLVQSIVPLDDPDLAIDPKVLALAIGASVFTALLVSALPALQVSRVPVGAVLKDGGRGTVSRHSGQRLLVGAQVGASLVLLASAAMVFGAFRSVLARHEDLTPREVTFGGVDLNPTIHDTVRQRAFFRTILPRVQSSPLIASAALTSSVPPMPWADRATIYRRGEEPPPNAPTGTAPNGLQVNTFAVSPEFFDVARIPILRGRGLLSSDDARSSRVVVVSRRLADALWPQTDPVGQMVSWPSGSGAPSEPLRVVGIAADPRDLRLGGAPRMTMYLPHEQAALRGLLLIVRGRPGVVVSKTDLEAIVTSVDAGVETRGVRTLEAEIRGMVRPQRTATAWIGVFGVIGLLLAAVGLYGVVAQGVIQRTREIAVRGALGATPANILRWILGDGLRVCALGLVAGAVAVLGAQRVLRSMLEGVGAIDPLAAALGLSVLALALLAATYLPARRAARLSPVEALRSD